MLIAIIGIALAIVFVCGLLMLGVWAVKVQLTLHALITQVKRLHSEINSLKSRLHNF